MLLDNHVVNINHEVHEWLISFNQAISTQISKEASIDLLYKLFFKYCHWRDLLALTWKIQTISGNENIIPKIYESIVAVQARSFSTDISGDALASPYDEDTGFAVTFETELRNQPLYCKTLQ